MSAIQGSKREYKEFFKRVGLGEFEVIAVNPDREAYEKILGVEYEKETDPEYLGEKDDIAYLRVEFWLRDLKYKELFKLVFFLKDENRMNKEKTKYQYINDIGISTWADNESNLASWFAGRDYRKAKIGEDDLYEFVRTWLQIDFKLDNARLQFDWKKLMKGDVSEIREQIGGNFDATVVCLATIQTVEGRDEEDNITRSEYQKIYSRSFLPGYTITEIRAKKGLDKRYVEYAKSTDKKNRRPLQKFVLKIVDTEHGCKDFFGGIPITELREYDPAENLAASEDVHVDQGEVDDSKF